MTFINEAAREFEMGPIDCANDLSIEALLRKEREKVIRECIEALPEHYLNDSYEMLNLTIDNCRTALESLLPKPDRATEIADEFEAQDIENDPATYDHKALRFARWLIAKGAKL